MVYSIDKLDGSVVSLIADKVDLKYDSEEDVVVTFLKFSMDTTTKDKDGKTYATFKYEIVGCYYLSNIVGFRAVAGISEEQLMKMYKDEAIAMNSNGEYCAKDDNDDNTEILI